ncbi:peptidase [Streptococcus castoreus]|uniref:peptidase n=1 Tax=Streptococcus castoreus TaxID=254786 RepID=UPI003CC67603
MAILFSYQLHWLTTTYCYLAMISLLFSLFDWHFQEYPFLLWLVSFLALLIFYPLNHVTLLLLLLGLLACFLTFPVGAGDFFYLANLALVFDLISLLWIIQLASLLGIIACLVLAVKRIPFIPYLSFGLIGVLILEKMTIL